MKSQGKNSQETKETSEQESDMTQILELSNREFKITMTNTLMALMDKVGTMQNHMGNHSTEMEHKRKDPVEMLEMLEVNICFCWASNTTKKTITKHENRDRNYTS